MLLCKQGSLHSPFIHIVSEGHSVCCLQPMTKQASEGSLRVPTRHTQVALWFSATQTVSIGQEFSMRHGSTQFPL